MPVYLNKNNDELCSNTYERPAGKYGPGMVASWVCNGYQIGNCQLVRAGSDVHVSSLPGQQDYKVIPDVYNYKACYLYKAARESWEGLGIVKDTSGTTNIAYINSEPTKSSIDNISAVNLQNSLVQLSTFYDLLNTEYNRRIQHRMYDNDSGEIETETKLTLKQAKDKLDESISKSTGKSINTGISGCVAVANIMNNIVKVLKVMDKGTSYFKDKYGYKVTSKLKTTNLIGDIIMHNKNNQGSIVLSALSVISQDCICYSDCTTYAVCYCYGNCNHY